MKKQFSKQQKAEYYKSLRERWQKAKDLTESKKDWILGVISQSGVKGISLINFMLVYSAMQYHGYDGYPYVDCKTFNKWKDSGFKVKKGEKSRISAIVWIDNYTKKEIDDTTGQEIEKLIVLDHVLPKAYHLFHKSQVEPIKE